MRAQGGLEMIIIIAVLMMTLAATAYVLVGGFSQSADNSKIGSCQEAASQCGIKKLMNPNSNCSECYRDCAVSGKDLLTGNAPSPSAGALKCCLAGNLKGIYKNSPGCADPGKMPLHLIMIFNTSDTVDYGSSKVKITLGGCSGVGMPSCSFSGSGAVKIGTGIYLFDPIAVGDYTFIYQSGENANYLAASVTKTLHVTKKRVMLGISAESYTVIVGQPVTVNGTNCPSALSCRIMLDGHSVISDDGYRTSSLSIGSHNFSYDTSGNSEYDAVTSGNITVTVTSKLVPSIRLTVTPSEAVTGSSFRAVGNCTSGLNCTLYRSGTLLGWATSGNVDVASALSVVGSYDYVLNTTGNAIYAKASNSTTVIVDPLPIATTSAAIVPSGYALESSPLEGRCSGTNTKSSAISYYYKWYRDGALSYSGFASGISSNQFYENADSIACSGSFRNSCSAAYDGDYGTYASTRSVAEVSFNYTKRDSAVSATWQVKTSDGLLNYSVFSDCLAQNTLQLKVSMMEREMGLLCYNGASWRTIATPSNERFYEEGVYLGISSSFVQGTESIVNSMVSAKLSGQKWIFSCLAANATLNATDWINSSATTVYKLTGGIVPQASSTDSSYRGPVCGHDKQWLLLCNSIERKCMTSYSCISSTDSSTCPIWPYVGYGSGICCPTGSSYISSLNLCCPPGYPYVKGGQCSTIP